MAVIGYMLTWTTYGSWLQGDRRGWVKGGEVFEGNSYLEKVNRENISGSKVLFDNRQREIAGQAILFKAKKVGQRVYGLAVCNNHVHAVLENTDRLIGDVVSGYKKAATKELRKSGFEGKVWTKGFDKRYCESESEILRKVEYIRGHKGMDVYIEIFE